MNLLNLGCGSTFHKDWVNIDFVSNSEHVKTHNLLEGLPFKNSSVNVVYHSHVLEHFSKPDGVKFIEECYRVLNTNGIIRIAVPDLERIAKEYLKQLEFAVAGQKEAKHNYNWMLLELFDQMTRNKSGGEMLSYLKKDDMPNESFVFERLGSEAKKIRNKKHPKKNELIVENKESSKKLYKLLVKLKKKIKHSFNKQSHVENKAAEIGKFRLGGEVHQWMYDRYSLLVLLESVGFSNITVCDAFNSKIPNWDEYQLDVVNNEVRKPDSLFIEAIKL